MALQIYNTLSRQKETFIPLEDKNVGMYTCGPTVYDYPHIGNLKAYVMWDMVKRTLMFLGYNVKHVMNITDVGHLVSDEDTGEDKMEKGATREGKTVWEIAQFYTDIFKKDLTALHIDLDKILFCNATANIPEQIALVKTLEEKGYTYIIEDGVYFDTSKFPQYGALARLDKEGLQAGARVELIPGKKNITDFALWKFSPKDQKRQMEWDSPWGKGFPGWHLECSAMSMKYLGETFDIHCGGVDHIPVHHTNEIAQSEAATGKLFVKYWMHNNFMLVEGKKMSKSLGNFYTLDDLLQKGYSAREIRYLFLSSHYRQEQNFTFQGLDQARSTLDAIDRFVQDLESYTEGTRDVDLEKKLQIAQHDFQKNIEDDFNIPGALRSVFEIQRYVNPLILQKQISQQQAGEILNWLRTIDTILGIFHFDVDLDVPSEVLALVSEREQARKKKDFKRSDELRHKIDQLGYIVRDTSQGQKLEKK
jgi:cysteinyl-tRNA synthetase